MYMKHWHRVRRNFNWNDDIHDDASNDKALRVHTRLEKVMTTVKPDGVCNIVINTMQGQQQQNRNDDEIQHDYEAPHVHDDAMYSTE